MTKQFISKIAGFIFTTALIILLFIISGINYKFYHSLIEMFGIIVACGVFMIAYNSREYMQNSFFEFIGIAFLFLAVFDFLHMLAYKGMGVFPGNDPNLATQLWIGSGYLRAVTYLVAPAFLKTKITMKPVFLSYSAVTSLLIVSIFYWKIFPECFIEGSGLTLFKISSEYIVSFILLVPIAVVYRKRDYFDSGVLKLLLASIVFTICSSMAFTLYTDVYGISNFSGHVLKFAAYGFIYQAIIYTGLRKPYDLLFRDLKQNELKLINAMSEIKTLSGILPICASCKKIRNDKGYWQMVEEYIGEHSDARFSHGMCLDCAKKLYPDIFNDSGIIKENK
jgi:hypothetical protein